MGAEWALTAYWICLFVGVGYTLIAAILGGFAGHGSIIDGHVGGFSHTYGVDHTVHAGHGTATSTSDAGQVIFGPFSPLVVAFFLTCFGAVGIVLTDFYNWKVWQSLPVAVVSSFVLAWLLIALFNRILGRMQSSSDVKLYSLIGTECEVTVDIPANGIGEIAYIAAGSRCVAPAQSDIVDPIPRFSSVRITRLVGNMFYVRPIVEEEQCTPCAPPVAAHEEKTFDD